MKLKVNLSYLPKFKWNAEVSSWRHGRGEYSKNRQVAKLIDELQQTIREAFKEFIEAIMEDFEEKYQFIYRGIEGDRGNDEQWNKFLSCKKKIQFWCRVKTGIVRVREEIKDKELDDKILRDVKKSFDDHVRAIDEAIFESIINGIEKGVDERVKDRPKIYNFLGVEIPDDLREMLERGKRFVPFLAENEVEAKEKFTEAVLRYLIRYRKYVEGAPAIDKNDLGQWLHDALDDATVWNVNSCHTQFYRRVKSEARDAMRVIASRKRKRSECSGVDMGVVERKLMKLEDGVVIENDKNNGWSLMPCAVILEAEHKMMEEMGGVLVERDENSVIGVIDEEISKFECGLGGDQLRIINKFYLHRRIQKDDVKMPFLRLTLKIHKLSAGEKEEKRFSVFRYRPLQDSTFCSLVVYNRIMMEMVRELNNKLKSVEPKMKKLESKCGSEFASRMRKSDINIRDGVVLLSGDFSDAYSFCTFVDVSRAIVVIGRFVGLQESRVELMIELAWLILTNNYVSCSVEIFHLGTALPMGNSCSGE